MRGLEEQVRSSQVEQVRNCLSDEPLGQKCSTEPTVEFWWSVWLSNLSKLTIILFMAR